MKDFINYFYRNHSLAYKVILFISATFLIVYLFPKSGKFKYNFERGKPWQSENLYAPFDFAIKKTDEEINAEKKNITDNSLLYFNVDTTTKERVVSGFNSKFKIELPDSDRKSTRLNSSHVRISYAVFCLKKKKNKKK